MALSVSLGFLYFSFLINMDTAFIVDDSSVVFRGSEVVCRTLKEEHKFRSATWFKFTHNVPKCAFALEGFGCGMPPAFNIEGDELKLSFGGCCGQKHLEVVSDERVLLSLHLVRVSKKIDRLRVQLDACSKEAVLYGSRLAELHNGKPSV